MIEQCHTLQSVRRLFFFERNFKGQTKRGEIISYRNFFSLSLGQSGRSRDWSLKFFFKIDVLFADAGDNGRKFKTARDVPGPFALPILGTRWIYSRFGYYSLNKIHEAYKGKEFGLCPYWFAKATLDTLSSCVHATLVANDISRLRARNERERVRGREMKNTVHYVLMCFPLDSPDNKQLTISINRIICGGAPPPPSHPLKKASRL